MNPTPTPEDILPIDRESSKEIIRLERKLRQVKEALRVRGREVVQEGHDKGYTTRQIARLAGLSTVYVQQVRNGHAVASPGAYVLLARAVDSLPSKVPMYADE